MAIPGTINGWVSKGINAPSSAEAADGALWYGITMARPDQPGVVFYCVWRELGTARELKWNGPAQLHRATLQVDNGKLIVTTYAGAGDGQETQRHVIPGFVAPLSAGVPGPPGPAGPKGDKGDPGPAGEGGGVLSERYRLALERLCVWLGIS